MQTCNTTNDLLKIKNQSPAVFESYFEIDGEGHMSSLGNAFIADQLQHCLEKGKG